MLYFALADDGEVYNLCDCGDWEAAEESARDMGINAVWIFDRNAAKNFAETIAFHLLESVTGE